MFEAEKRLSINIKLIDFGLSKDFKTEGSSQQ